jgi:hypothetical protein
MVESYPWLYWTQRSNAGEVHRISRSSSAVEVHAGSGDGTGAKYANIEAIAVSTSTVAWTSGSGVFATKVDSAVFTDPAGAELIDAATDGRGIVVYGDAVYYLSGGELRTKTRGAVGPVKTIAKVCASYRWLALDSTYGTPPGLLWTCGADGGVFRMPRPL